MDRNVSSQRVMYSTSPILLMLGFSSILASATSSPCPANNFPLSPQICSGLESLPLTGYLTFCNTSFAAQDFGMSQSFPPVAVLYPGSEQDIASIVSAVNKFPLLTIAARGPGHSTNGQSQALHGIVIEMSALTGIVVNTDEMFVETSAGELWVDVLQATLKEGLTPKSFTDYLHLSVGGTLSNAGVSGQAYRWGPQISNVLQLEVVTGVGNYVTCSRDQNSDLFFAVLGGLGQFGIITKARISLQPAYPNVRWLRAIYSDFTLFKQDQEFLISQASSFDYIEGEVISNTADPIYGYNSVPFPGTGQAVNSSLLPSPASTSVLYYIELVKYYNNATESQISVDEESAVTLVHPLHRYNFLLRYDDAIQDAGSKFLQRIAEYRLGVYGPGNRTVYRQSLHYASHPDFGFKKQFSELAGSEEISNLLAPLKFISTQVFSIDTSYFDFLERVYATQLLLQSLGQWDVPHPWLDIFVPATKIEEFDQAVFKSLNQSTINGPVIVYPFNRNKWDVRMSAQTPDEDVFYLVGFLWSVLPSGPSLTTLKSRNAEVVNYCQSLGCKEYIPTYSTRSDWEKHFGDNWKKFVRNKNKFDPQSILAPGQNIFARGQVPPLT